MCARRTNIYIIMSVCMTYSVDVHSLWMYKILSAKNTQRVYTEVHNERRANLVKMVSRENISTHSHLLFMQDGTWKTVLNTNSANVSERPFESD